MSNLTILNTPIRQIDNLFSLNELHKVSGNEEKHRPTFFIRLDTTKDLVAEIQKQDPNNQAILSKNGIGTYACKEIVIAYAAWISPQFHLVVLRAFLNQLENSQNNQQTAPLTNPVAEEETMHIIVNLFHCLNEAYELGRKLCDEHPHLARELNKQVGGHYLHNLHHPARNALDKAKRYIQAESERIMFIKGMIALLETPKPKVVPQF